MTSRENFLRSLEMKGPDWIPFRVNFARQVWKNHRERLGDVFAGHPAIFEEFRRGSLDFDYLRIQYAGNLSTFQARKSSAPHVMEWAETFGANILKLSDGRVKSAGNPW